MPYTVLDPSAAKAAPSTTIGEASSVAQGFSFRSLEEMLDKRLFYREDMDETDRLQFLEMAYVDLCTSLRLEKFKASISLSVDVNQPLYLLPSCVGTVINVASLEPASVSASEGRPLELIDLEAYRTRSAVTGLVEQWFRQGAMLVVWPTPEYAGTTLAVDFWVRPVMPTTDYSNKYPILDPEWHEAILLLAKQKALMAVEEVEAAMAAQNEYVNFVRRRRDFASEEMIGKPVSSSVPTSRQQLRHPRGTRYN